VIKIKRTIKNIVSLNLNALVETRAGTEVAISNQNGMTRNPRDADRAALLPQVVQARRNAMTTTTRRSRPRKAVTKTTMALDVATMRTTTTTIAMRRTRLVVVVATIIDRNAAEAVVEAITMVTIVKVRARTRTSPAIKIIREARRASS